MTPRPTPAHAPPASGGSRIAFLLGAGASYEAGLPLLAQLTKEVPATLTPPLQELYAQLGERQPAEPGDSAPRNVEDILSAADSFAAARMTWEGHPPRDLSLLAFEVRKRIWRLLSRPFETRYLAPLAGLARDLGGLLVFSLNNDLVLERWSKEQGLRLHRGFDDHEAHPNAVPPEAQASIELIKLHGSLDWQLDRQQALRPLGRALFNSQGMLALRSPVPELVLVFPSRVKVLTAPPLQRLMQHFYRGLDEISALVVVGCRLGDAHIFDALVAALLRNPQLRLLLVDPAPAEAVSRLQAKLKDREAERRVDILPLGFGRALAGPLALRLAELRAGRSSLGSVLVDLARYRADGAGLAASRRAVEEKRQAGGVAEEERQAARQWLGSLQPPLGVAGAVPSLLRGLVEDLAQPIERVLPALARRLDSVAADGSFPAPGVIRGLAVEGATAFLLPRSPRRQPLRLEGGRLVPVGRPLRSPNGFAIVGGKGYAIQSSLRGFEGIGVLRELDLATGRRRVVWLRRPGLPRPHLGRTAVALLATLVRGRRQIDAPSLGDLKVRLVEHGFLNYPSNARALGPERLIVVESRQASIVLVPGGAVETATPDHFLNLLDAVGLGSDQVLLLEAGAAPESEGSLWLWRPQRGEVTRAFPRLRSASGLCWDESRRRLLVAVSYPAPEGAIWSLPVGLDGLVSGPAEPLVEGLHQPSLMCQLKGRLLVASGWGLIEVDLATL